MPIRTLHALAFCLLIPALHSFSAEKENEVIGVQADGRILVPTNQALKPAGKEITFPGRPVDLHFTDGGDTLIVKNSGDLIFIDVKELKIKAKLPLGGKQAQ